MPDHPRELTPEQQAIVRTGVDAKVLVTAGAGTGKTHVLVERLAYLVEKERLFPGTDLLVLSFSRAAVAEIRRRLSATADATAYVGAVTFDAFATRLLADIDPDGDWMSAGYDKRIRVATDVITNQFEALEHLSAYRHVLIDEIQDLVGPRARLVMALVERLPAGLTLFGDPAQSIYVYQRAEDGETPADVYRCIREGVGSALIERGLTKNFRATGTWVRKALDFGPRLQDDEPVDLQQLQKDLDGFLLQIPSLKDLGVAIEGWRRNPPKADAILCRTNGEALLIMHRLAEAGVACRLRSDATDRPVASWIAAATRGIETPRINKKAMLIRLADVDPCGADLPSQLKWNLLKQVDMRRDDDLDLRRIARRVSMGALPQDVYEDAERGVIVSTIHRAKGLEFDKVILLEFEIGCGDADETLETIRLAYVALTRPRHQIFLMKTLDRDNLSLRKDKSTRRWTRAKFRGGAQRPQVHAVQVRPLDTDRSVPPEAPDGEEPRDPVEIQRYIYDAVKLGDQIRLVRDSGSDNGTSYRLDHAGMYVGRTSPAFATDLQRLLHGKCPDTIDGLYVDSTETIAGNCDETKRCGLGTAGLWLIVRVVGFGEVGV